MRFHKWIQKSSQTKFFTFFCLLCLLTGQTTAVFATTDTAVDYDTDAAMRLEEPIDSNAIDGWPTGPVVGAEGAILLEANTGTILYAKNIHEHLYPASTTKILTTLVAIENSDLNDMVEFSNEAVFSIEQKSSNMGMDVGQSITMEQCLYGILVYSANEVCNAVGEHIAGSISGFVDMMNAKAAELGCTDSHFVTTNGLHDENHYTTVYDIYLMLQEAMTYPHFLEIAQLSSYNLTCNRGEQEVTFHLDATDQYLTRQVTAPKNVTVLGGKTGTTSDAGSCLALLSQNAYGEPYISIVLHAANKTNLYTYMNQLLSAINQ